MNLLFISHRIPFPPNKGDKIRSFHWLRHLAARHRVHLACLVDDPDDLAHLPALEKLCASVDAVFQDGLRKRLLAGQALLSGRPLSVAAFFSGELKRRIDRRLDTERVDAVVAYSSATAEYVKEVRHVPKLLDLVDVDSEKWFEYSRYAPSPYAGLYRLEGTRLRHYEAELGELFDRCVFVSKGEEALYRTIAPSARTATVPNGVDAEYFRRRGEATAGAAPVVVFTGAMDYQANVDAVLHFYRAIFPAIREGFPGVRFEIVGRNPDRAIRRLARDRQVVVTGSVPDVRPYLEQATVAVAPLRIARGIQNKILEAMAMGVPVVTTSNGFEGLDAEPGRDLFVHDAPREFADRVLALLRDEALRGRVSASARRAAVRTYDWRESVSRFEALLVETVAARAGRTVEPRRGTGT